MNGNINEKILYNYLTFSILFFSSFYQMSKIKKVIILIIIKTNIDHTHKNQYSEIFYLI